jgi:hypothetical protein
LETSINLKELWDRQSSTHPNSDELFIKINSLQKANLKKLILTNVLMFVTAFLICLVWYYFHPQMLTTKMGIILVILAMIIYLSVYNQSIPLLKKMDPTLTNNDYLKNLLAIKAQQNYMQTTMLNLYFIMLSTGLCLYMIEYARQMTVFWGMITYIIVIAWILFNWFYLRPKQIKSQEQKLDSIINKFEKISKQLEP